MAPSAHRFSAPFGNLLKNKYEAGDKRRHDENLTAWIRQDSWKWRIISDDTTLTHTVSHHYAPPPPDRPPLLWMPADLPIRLCATNIDCCLSL